LKIHVERTEEKRQKGHSEFHYGRLMRSMTLPPGVMVGSAAAKYADGILEISFKLGERSRSTSPAGRSVGDDIGTPIQRFACHATPASPRGEIRTSMACPC